MIEILPVPGGLPWHDPAVLAVTVLGAGLVAPLRAGLAVALVTLLMLAVRRRTSIALLAVIVAIGGFAAIATFEAAAGVHDDRRIVVDEVLGALVIGVLLGTRRRWRLVLSMPAYLALDRWKPFPLDRIEDLGGASGVLLDDAAAGLAVAVAVLALTRLLTWWRRPDAAAPGMISRRKPDTPSRHG